MAAYACPVQGSPAAPVIAHAAAAEEITHHPCGAAAPDPAPPQTVACEVHCTDGVTLPASPDLPPVVLTALPVPATPLPTFATVDGAARVLCAALPGAPPPSHRFCRLLI